MSSKSESRLELFSSLYETNNTTWHRTEVNPALEKYLHLLGEAPSAMDMEPAVRKVFVPLCGKSADIVYLLGQGYHVFGIEGVQQAIQEFIAENNLDMAYDEERSIYYTMGEKLVIYYGDIFKCPIDDFGPFQAVWDRGAFGAIPYDQREQYVAVIRRGLNEMSFRYLLEAYAYNRDLISKLDTPGPLALPQTEIEMHVGEWASVELLSSEPTDEDFRSRHPEFIGQECNLNIYFIQSLKFEKENTDQLFPGVSL